LGQLPLQFLAGFGEQAAPRLGLAFGLVVVAGALALLLRLAEPLRLMLCTIRTAFAAFWPMSRFDCAQILHLSF